MNKSFKKLALEYFPEIMQLSATGLREVDYSLYLHKEMIQDRIYTIIDDKVSVSAEVFIDDIDVNVLNI